MSSRAPLRQATVETRPREKYERLLAAAKSVPKLNVAVAYQCNEASLSAALQAASLQIIEPILSDWSGLWVLLACVNDLSA